MDRDEQKVKDEVENSRNSADDVNLVIEDGCAELSDIPADCCWTWKVIEEWEIHIYQGNGDD